MIKAGNVALYIDASGVRIPNGMDGTSSHHIFIYQAVINCGTGQFSVTRFLSEIHTSTYIRLWLMEWCRIGAPHPKEVVTDSPRVLFIAIVKEFTGYMTVEQYADACRNTVPSTYIRIEVAHFLENYALAVKKYSRPVRNFYLASMGQLVLSRQVLM